MIVTARQLEELHRESGKNGRITLRAGTRLSPLARDWMRKSRVEIEYVDAGVLRSTSVGDQRTESPRLGRIVWWCDGPCPVAKAALMMQESFVNLRAITTSSDASHIAIAVRKVADEISSHRADAGVLIVSSGGTATVHANRLNELRAVVATTIDSLDAAMKSIKPNVLIVEHAGQSLPQIEHILTRFLRGGGCK
jgi:ribose 5-phosphate isomerase RpiB